MGKLYTNPRQIIIVAIQKPKPDTPDVEDPEVSEDGVTEEEAPPVPDREEFAAEVSEKAKKLSRQIDITGMAEPSGQVTHAHGPVNAEGIHDLRDAFGVRDEFISEFFPAGILPNGHESVTALALNKEEAINHPEPIFSDADDDCQEKWDRISSTGRRAYVPKQREKELAEMFC